MGLARIPARIEGKGRSGGRIKSAQALLGMDSQAAEGTTRPPPLQGLRRTGFKRPSCLKELAAKKLAVKSSASQPLLLCAPPPARHRELLQQAAQQPAAGGMLEALLHDATQ